MSGNEQQLRADIVEVGRRLYARGYTASNDGNISVRLDAGRLLMTPKSVCKGFMDPAMMCITDLDGTCSPAHRDGIRPPKCRCTWRCTGSGPDVQALSCMRIRRSPRVSRLRAFRSIAPCSRRS